MLTYKSNAGSVVLSITEKLKATQMDMDKLVREVANNFYVENLRRIHNTGKDVNIRLIGAGKYSTKSTYISVSQSPVTITPAGKSEEVYSIKTKKRTDKYATDTFRGKKRTTRYYSDGYKGFRSDIGRTVSHVNLDLSGKLLTDFIIQNVNGKYLIGFESQYGKDISGGMEEKYNQKIWGVSKDGEQQAKDITIRFIKDHLK